MRLEVKKAELISQITELLEEANLVPVGLEQENLHLFCNIDNTGKVAGVVGIETYKSACLLRSLAVRADVRNLGIARSLVKEALDFARSVKCFDVYLLTETIGQTMQRYGFKDIERARVPSDLLKSPFFNGICPCSCSLMHKNIREGD